MQDKWYCEIAGRVIGPMSSEQLKAMATSGRLLPTDPVRSRESIDWVEAEHVSGLFESPAPPRVIDPPKGIPPALPVRSSPAPTPNFHVPETPPDIPLARPVTRVQSNAVIDAFDAPVAIHGGRLSAAHARSKRRRQQQMLINGMTLFVVAGVVILCLFWAAGIFDASAPEAREVGGHNESVSKATPKPPDVKTVLTEKHLPASPPSADKAKEPKAIVDVASAKKSPEKPPEKPAEKEEPEQPDNEDESKWIDASTMSPAVFDKIQVDILSATWQGTETDTPDAARLVISIRVRNTGVAFPANFTGWSPTATQQGVTLIDNRQKPVKAKPADPANTVDNMLPLKINPGKSGRDVLIFDTPSPKMKYLRLKLSAAPFGKEGTAQFKIPATMIEGTPASAKPATPKPAAVKSIEKPAPPKPAQKPRRPNDPGPSGNPKDDFGIDPNAAPRQ